MSTDRRSPLTPPLSAALPRSRLHSLSRPLTIHRLSRQHSLSPAHHPPALSPPPAHHPPPPPSRSWHLGGSRSAAAHAIALAQESGGSVGENLYATFRRYHFKNGVWSDAKSQRIGDEVERRLEEARQPLSDATLPPAVDPNAIYLEVIGGPNSKNRIFGIDSLYSDSQSATSPAGCSPSQPFTSVGPTPEQIHEQIQQQVQEQLAAQRAVYETLLKESQDKFHEGISALRSTMMDFITHGTQPPPGSGSGS